MLGITGQYLNALQAAWNNVPSGFLVGEVNSEEATALACRPMTSSPPLATPR